MRHSSPKTEPELEHRSEKFRFCSGLSHWILDSIPGVKSAKTVVQQQRTTEGQTALLQRGSTAAVPLLVEHSHISDLGGQRLVSAIQYTIIELFYHLAPRRRYVGVD